MCFRLPSCTALTTSPAGGVGVEGREAKGREASRQGGEGGSKGRASLAPGCPAAPPLGPPRAQPQPAHATVQSERPASGPTRHGSSAWCPPATPSTALRAKPVVTNLASLSSGSHSNPGSSWGRWVGGWGWWWWWWGGGGMSKDRRAHGQSMHARRLSLRALPPLRPAHQRLADQGRVVLGLAHLAVDVAHAGPPHLPWKRGKASVRWKAR